MRLIVLSLIGLSLFYSSCDNNNNKYYLKQIDSLNYVLDKAFAEYNKVDTLSVSDIRTRVKSNCKRVRSDEDAEIMSTFILYSHLDKSIKQILRLDARIKKETAFAKSQLNDLYYDASNNLINEELLKAYYNEEKQVITTLINRMEYNAVHIIRETHRYDSLNPIIENHLKIIN